MSLCCAGALSYTCRCASDVGLIFLFARVVVGGGLSSRLLRSIGVLSVANLSSSVAVGLTRISALGQSASSLDCRISVATSSDAGCHGSVLLDAVAASWVAFLLSSSSLVILASSARRAAVNSSSRRPASRSFQLRPSDVAVRHCSILRRHSSEWFLLCPSCDGARRTQGIRPCSHAQESHSAQASCAGLQSASRRLAEARHAQ